MAVSGKHEGYIMVCFTATLVLTHTGKMSSKTRRESLPVYEKKQQEPHKWSAYSFPPSAQFATAIALGT